ncbi:MAG: hypothetical protein ACFNYJ_00285 [Segatella oris]|uniref:hypothetical protein n=1 Tax=Segatella oris TaxID=28135 RepID=UPI00039D92D5|nr:hypothetical protein [Segatella oris]
MAIRSFANSRFKPSWLKVGIDNVGASARFKGAKSKELRRKKSFSLFLEGGNCQS